MGKYIKVELFIRQPKETLELCDKIVAKDTLDGAGSSLTGVIDMTAYAAKVSSAKTLRSEADSKDRTALRKYEDIETACGVRKGQNKDTENTILWYVRQIKKLLTVIHKGSEEALNEYGFDVIVTQTGARRNVKIELPKEPQPVIELGEAIVAQHTLLGAGSPLTPALVDMAAFTTLVTGARTLLTDWTTLRGQVQSKNNEALNIIGYAEGQTSSTDGTIYFDNGKIRNRLLQKFMGTEEALSEWGFDVVISERSTGRKKGIKPSITGTVTDTLGNKISGALVLVIEPDIFVATDAQGKYEVPQLTPATYSLLVHKSGYADKQVGGIVVTAGATTTANVVLASASTSATVSGQITQGGSGAPGTVTIQVAGSPQVISTDGAGNYIIPNVPPGNYALQGALDSNPANIITHNITAVAGETTTVNFVFP